jgi:fatty-acyl-CoA synthase
MTETRPPKPHRSPAEVVQMARRHTARTALLLAVLAVLTLGFAAFGLREAMFDLDYAVRTLALGWAPGLAMVALILGGLAFLAAVIVPPRRDRIASLLAVALGAGVMATTAQIRTEAAVHPPIHDVATDWSEPLMFGATITAARAEAAADNRVEAAPKVEPQPQDPNLTGTPIAAVNARTCPGAVPAVLTGSPLAAYDKAKAAVTREGFAIVTDNPEGGRLEATATTKYLKQVGDLIVRVKPEGAGARVDIRSISRMGIADLGENCRRVTKLRAAVAKE